MRLASVFILFSLFILTISLSESQGQRLRLKAKIVDQNCSIGQLGLIDLEVRGGQAPYSFYWDNGVQQKKNDQLIAGNYSVTVTDVNGNRHTQTFWVRNETGPSLSFSKKDWSNTSRGSITLDIKGGSGPLKIFWPGNDMKRDRRSVSGLSPGYYSVIVYDSDNCSAVLNNIEILKDGK